MCGNPAVVFQTEREREKPFKKKKRTVRVSRRRRRLSGGGGGGSVMMMRAVVVVVVVVVAILQRREKIHRRCCCLRSFGGHFCVSRTNLRDGCSRACRAKKRGKRVRERVFVCLLDRTFRDGSRLVSSRSVRLFSLLLSAGWESDEWRIVSFGSAAGSFIFSREFN